MRSRHLSRGVWVVGAIGIAGCSSEDLEFGELTTGTGAQGTGNTGAGAAEAGGGAGASGGAGGTNEGGEPGAGGAGEGGRAEGGDGSGGDNSGPGCDKLLEDVEKLLAKAQECSITLPVIQCNTFVEGVCCPVPVANGNSGDTQKYLEALADFEAAGCTVVCPPERCDDFPTGSCDSNNGGIEGTCVQN